MKQHGHLERQLYTDAATHESHLLSLSLPALAFRSDEAMEEEGEAGEHDLGLGEGVVAHDLLAALSGQDVNHWFSTEGSGAGEDSHGKRAVRSTQAKDEQVLV